ncbi:MAG: Metal dependent phosphohydrolase [Microgenomates group bacterium GW2011_GWC1_37_8]|uniref:Metal dependent phosphohydrolase n=1 Tax=Candidatus Woesebacteria bacterium GW2011_GWB1_38_8 TaxID=1618570 RepID=A0A0G0P5N4_9BACT|nr:MAG: Metal dependent phosphohydrolase [Microgenomates group bacterium GW2011_GWC1_37_8]KKQ84591.1 MAG: Metal dependent phosphohydrolase [Candidatus Woesebacteria bacterium GW2011_GWB1_38_8]
MNKSKVINETAEFVRNKLQGEGSGHDWWHVYRVWQTAKVIAKKEKVDTFNVELAALLHDIADWKFYDGDESVGPRIAGDWLEKQGLDEKSVKFIKEAIEDVSFKGAGVKKKVRSKEGGVVQDADRLDAIGAIGIGRTFAYGGFNHREMYNPDTKVLMAKNFEEYKAAGQTTINHFYEKLLLLKDLMNTKTAKKIAGRRHRFMEEFLDEFFKEWKGQS